MSLFGSLYVGVSGLQTSNNALNTTAHNMSNLDTEGYTRQQVAQGTRTYVTVSKNNTTNWKQLGLGVNYSQTRQVRDYFLDLNYRRESGRSAFYDVSVSAMEEIENILGESNEGQEFSESLSNLWTAVEELSKDPTSSVNQNLFVTRSYEFLTSASAVYNSLCEYQDNLNKTVYTDVRNINSYAQEIEALNRQIVRIEAGGMENANDLRDRRNYLLDELAKLGSISYAEDTTGYVSVQFENFDLVKGGTVNEMAVYTDPETGFYTPYWVMLTDMKYDKNGNLMLTEEDIENAKVFDFSREISSELDTDIGALKSVLLARGDHRAVYSEIQDINDEGEYQEGWYNDEIAPSIIMNIQAEFDQLINAVVTRINEVLADAAERESQNNPGSDYLRDENGDPYQLFERKTDAADWTVSNLTINMELRQNPALLTFRLSDHSEDQETMEALKAIFEESIYTLNPNVETPVCFRDYYKNLVAQVANTGYVLRGIQDSQTAATDALSYAREQIVGVSSDEELTNMIMYQNAYNAASRYINVVNEMIEHLLTALA